MARLLADLVSAGWPSLGRRLNWVKAAKCQVSKSTQRTAERQAAEDAVGAASAHGPAESGGARSMLNLRGLKAPRNHKISVFSVRNWQLYCPEWAVDSGKDMDIAYLTQRRGIRRFTENLRETGSGETGCAIAAIACCSRPEVFQGHSPLRTIRGESVDGGAKGLGEGLRV